MDKFDYESKIYNIKKLERQLKKIEFEKEYLNIIKPSILEFKKRKDWKINKQNLLIKEEKINKLLLLAYTNLEKIF